ncbi:hypothetical protein M407DRAFT_187481 [Tulasnella calospora MUT 4182]|uniref:Uncharacterized protein n=1 Tax=Tulasnella calospora MUT 4182 TaxID=1051891 RepID=A0A0C3QMA3_9AGAM|nr:hypothetical protein M407DRAFT_187481 [Tulasnella calospora MUT 4182]
MIQREIASLKRCKLPKCPTKERITRFRPSTDNSKIVFEAERTRRFKAYIQVPGKRRNEEQERKREHRQREHESKERWRVCMAKNRNNK